jgi:hypothetical protein
MAAPERIDQPSAPPSQNQLETGWHEQLQMLLNEPVPIQEYVIANTNEIHGWLGCARSHSLLIV